MRSTRPAAGRRPHRDPGVPSPSIKVRVDAAQLELLRGRARTAGLGLAAYLRQLALADGERPPAAPTAPAAALGRLAAAAAALVEQAAYLERWGPPGSALGAAADLLRAVAAETVEIRRLLLAPTAAADPPPRRGDP